MSSPCLLEDADATETFKGRSMLNRRGVGAGPFDGVEDGVGIEEEEEEGEAGTDTTEREDGKSNDDLGEDEGEDERDAGVDVVLVFVLVLVLEFGSPFGIGRKDFDADLPLTTKKPEAKRLALEL